MEFAVKRSGMLNFTFNTLLMFSFKIFVLTLERDFKLQMNILKFGYRINYKYKGQSSHSTDRYYIVIKFQLSQENDNNYNKCDYLSPDNEIIKKHANLCSDFQNGQVQYICNKIMIIARRLDVQYQQYNVIVR